APAQGLLAQRTIEREWGPSDDSLYVVVDVPGLKSEPLATSMSAILPGAGQLYCQERSGWLYLAVEAAGWGGWWWYRDDAERLNDDGARRAGPPDQSGSGWSFERWSTATEGDPGNLAALYAADPHAFYNAIAFNPAYAAGWSDAQTQSTFGGMLDEADGRLRRSRVFSTGLWFNHLIAAVDALRAARFHNLPLRRNMAMRVQSRGTLTRPAVAMSLEVKF